MPASVSLHHVEEHVGVLLLGALGAVPFGIGVGRDVEGVVLRREIDVAADVLGERGIDLVEHVLPVVERPHLADRLVADAGDDPADVVHDRVDSAALGLPVLAGPRQLETDGEALAGVRVEVVMMSRVASSCAMS